MPSPQPTVAQFLNQVIRNSGLTQAEIAKHCGFASPHMISMMKNGKARVPLNQIRPLARALMLDCQDFARRVLGEYQPELLEILFGISTAPAITHKCERGN